MKLEKQLEEENKTNPNCYYYNWGGDLDKGYVSYPRIYGARCEYYDEFFSSDRMGVLTPNCFKCEYKLLLEKN